MSIQPFEPRVICSRCRRPERVCYCGHIRPIETRTRVVILQHPRERDVPIGTAYMASLCLPQSELFVGTNSDDPDLVRALSDPARPAVLLYPAEDAIDVTEDPPRGPVTLVVVDGTWSQAKKIVRRDPRLASLPRYAFKPRAPSEYRIRREPTADCVSTIEALVHVLGALEDSPVRFDALLEPFRAMVEMQLQHHGNPRRIARPRRPLPVRLPTIVRERAEDLVCVVGEANSWPYGSAERRRYDEELVHWSALRVATGETFEMVLAPKNPLASGTPRWVEIAEDEIVSGHNLDELRAAWSAFARPSDVFVTWGRFAGNIFARANAPLDPCVDLRHAARLFLHGKVGTMDDFLGRIDRAAARVGSGRAGRRLGQLAEIARYFATAPASD